MNDLLRDAFRQFMRNDRWGVCPGCPRDTDGHAYPECCKDTREPSHRLTLQELVMQYEFQEHELPKRLRAAQAQPDAVGLPAPAAHTPPKREKAAIRAVA